MSIKSNKASTVSGSQCVPEASSSSLSLSLSRKPRPLESTSVARQEEIVRLADFPHRGTFWGILKFGHASFAFRLFFTHAGFIQENFSILTVIFQKHEHSSVAQLYVSGGLVPRQALSG
jgi:hypothetical protein